MIAVEVTTDVETTVVVIGGDVVENVSAAVSTKILTG